MTLDELEQIFDRAKADEHNSGKRAGIRAVVEALRDDMTLGWEDDRPWGDVADVKKFLNKILASDGGGAAGGSTREDEKAVEAAGDKGPVTVNSPATDPAPAVCEWTSDATRGLDGLPHLGWNHPHGWTRGPKGNRKKCHHCGLPIKFTEAKT